MNLGQVGRRFGVGVLAVVALSLSGCGRDDASPGSTPAEIQFSILSAQGQASSGPLWQPLLDDLSEAIGVPVTPHFESSYTALVDGMKRGQTQVAWLSAQPAIDAIDQAEAEVIARTIDTSGANSYRATLIVKRGSGITLEAVLACGRKYDFGIGDARSTSGTLAPTTLLFNPNAVTPETCFRTIRSANHETNAFSVASGVLDVATSNSVSANTLRRQNPAIADQIEQIWQSPPIPESGILLRDDLDPVLKEKIRSFFLTYGQGDGAEADRQRRVLAALGYSRFGPAENDYLDPVREMVADQNLALARASGDRAAIAAADLELQRLRAKREVHP